MTTKNDGDEAGSLLIALFRVLAFSVAGVAVVLSVGLDRFGGGAPGFGIAQQALLIGGIVFAGLGSLSARYVPSVLLGMNALFAALVVAELVVRAVYGPYVASVLEPDPELIYRLKPSSARIMARDSVDGGQHVRTEVNQDGYIGPELRDGDFRIAVFGDSFVAGEFSERENRFTARLAAYLRDRVSVRVEVVNAGVVGYGPDQAYLRMLNDFGRLEPDLVVFAVAADNDFGDLVRNKLHVLDASNGLVRQHPRLSDEISREFVTSRLTPVLGRMALRAMSGGDREVPQRGRPLFQRWIDADQRSYRELVQGDRIVRLLVEDHYSADVSLVPEGPSARYQVSLMQGVLESAHRTLRDRGVPHIFVIIPSGIDVVPDYHVAHVDPEEFPGYDRRRLTGIVDGMLTEIGVPHVNLFEPFWHRGARDLFFRGGDAHWNDAGQALAAEVVGGALLANDLLGVRVGSK